MAQPRWLDEREHRAWRGFQRMRVELGSALDRQLAADSALSAADYAVLVALSEAPEDVLRVGELARVLRWEKSRLSHQLSRMNRRALVLREECPEDARGAFVRLTPEGRQTIEHSAPGHVDAVRSFFVEALTPDQLDALSEISSAVLHHLDALESER